MSNKSLLKTLKDNVPCSQIVRKRDGSGNFILRKSYFYQTTKIESFIESIKEHLKKIENTFEIVDSGNHWVTFKGGAPIAKQSHYWVEVSITES